MRSRDAKARGTTALQRCISGTDGGSAEGVPLGELRLLPKAHLQGRLLCRQRRLLLAFLQQAGLHVAHARRAERIVGRVALGGGGVQLVAQRLSVLLGLGTRSRIAWAGQVERPGGMQMADGACDDKQSLDVALRLLTYTVAQLSAPKDPP